MKYKKILFILVIFIFLFSVSGAYAENVADAAVASEDAGIELTTTQNDVKTIEKEQMINVTDNSEVLSASDDSETVVAENDLDVLSYSQGTYSDLAGEIASGGTLIELAHDYYTCHELNTIVVNHACVIDGKGAVIDMAGSNIQTFKVEADGVIFKNLTIINAYHKLDSAGIHFEKSGALINCNFINNVAVMGNGGAVYFNGKGEVTNCNFTNNTAECLSSSTYGNLGDCGAVYFNSNGTVTNCNFVNNKATGPDGWGGAVYFNGKGEVTNCNFTDNSALIAGGIYFASSGTVENCNFTNNSALGYYSGGVNLNFGGAVYFKGKGDVIKCNFVDNSANFDGGAVYFGSSGTVENCNFTDNSANNDGGALFFYRTGNVINCNFTDNSANNDGGALFFYRTGNVINCNFTDSSAQRDGGAVYLYNSGNVINCNFVDNSANNDGGAVKFNQVSTGIVKNCNFTNNVASSKGGAAFFNSVGNVTNCNFVGNKATASGSSGGAVYFYGSGSVENCNFTNNVASSKGGAAFFNSVGNVTNCNFVGNKATASGSFGGAVYFYGSGSVENCNFSKNAVAADGGAVYFNSAGDVTNCNFTNNVASANGGAAFFNGTCDVTNCNFVHNQVIAVKGCGGAICFSEGNVENSNFINNKAGSGGAILCDGSGTVTNCSFADNKATVTGSTGGAIRWNGDNGVVSDCIFENNLVYDENGAPWWEGSNAEGGAIWWQGSNGVVSGCSFVNNSATYYGGAIRWTNNNGVISGCVFVNNRAKYGVIYFRNSQIPSEEMGLNLTINNNIFLNNDDAAIYFYRDDSTSNADNNWFGNNATNYNIKPTLTHVTINNWLFLNVTANPDPVSYQNGSDITFKLYSYGSDGISEYDNTLLNPVVLTITPNILSLNTSEVNIGNPVHYSPMSMGIGEITATIENVAFTASFAITDGTSFYDLNKLINGNKNDTIILDKDYAYNPLVDSDFKNGVVINRTVTIIGNNHTLNGVKQSRIFNIQAEGVTVRNITFINGKTAEYGGALLWFNARSGSVSDCSFVNNSADNHGGAISWYGSPYGSVSGCSFVDNSADNQGGAISWYYGDHSNISSCIFVNNSANNGDIYFFNEESGNLNINNNVFLNSNANAIVFYQDDYISNVDYNWFGNNATNYSIKPQASDKFTMDKWLFLNATATPDAIIALESSDIIFKLYLYNSNSGAISDYDNAPFKNIELTVTATNGTVGSTAKLAEPIQFTSTNKGPYTVTATIEDVTQTIGINGKGDFDILQEMVNNESLSVINLERDYIFNEFDSMTDGVIITRNITINGNGHIIDAKGKSRILNVKADNVTIINVTFINGMAPPNKDGGAIYWDHADYGNVSGCSFVNNSANNRGGAIYWSDDTNYGSVSDCSFVNNSATARGGAIYWYGGVYGSISGSNFVNNSADDTGGALYLNGVDYASVSGCSFVDNSADNDGGSICWVGEYGNVSDCIFADNIATNHGGAIYWFDSDHGRISGCIFVNNSANKGIVYFYDYFSVNLTVNNNIFLDNDVSAVDFLKEDSTSNVNYNWFGHNATDYNVNPNLPSCTVWLFLNATATSDTLMPLETSEIIFNLYAYDSNSQGVAEYDDALFNNINLTVTSTRGSVDKRVAKLNENIKFTPTERGIGSVTAEFENAMYTIVIDIRIDPNLSFGPQEVIYSNSTFIAVSYNSTATGKLNITLIGKKSNYLFVDLDLNETIQLGDIGADEYEVTVKYSGDYNFTSSTVTGNLTVNKADSSVILNNVEFDEGEHIIIIAITEGAEGVTAKIDGNNVDVINNVILVPEGLDDGNHTLEVTTIPDKNHNSVNRTVTIYTGSRHIRENTPISLDVYSIENNATFTVNVDEDATGIVRFELSGPEEYTVYVDVSKGKAVLDNVLVVGDYEVVATYMGDDRFNSNITSERFTINGHVKKDTPISADAKVNGNLVTITVNVDGDATGFVGLKQAGSTIYVSLDNGVATYADTFDAGSYNVDVSYLGDDDFNENSTVLQFTVVEVAKENTTITLDVETFENNATFTVNVNPNATGIVRFEVKGAEEYTVYSDVLNGKAVMEDVLSVGNYTVVVTYMGDSRFNSNLTSKTFNIKGHVKIDTPIIANADVNGYRVTVTVEGNENATGFVNMKFGDTEFNIALNNGVGSLIVDLPANSYNVDVTYLGDDNFNQNKTKLTFTVVDPVKENTPMGLDVSSIENNATFTVTLNSDATGIVRFDVSGAENYTVYADVVNGKALMEDVLSVGDYEVVATYMGDSRFNSNITSARFAVNGHVKKDTPISADAKINGNLVTITVNVDESAGGFVGLKMAGSTIYVPVENGVATYVNSYAAGSYNVEVTYTGDDDFNENSTRLLFTVVVPAKENTPISLDVSSVENNATFTVSVNSDATGIVRFDVSGAENYTVYADIVNGMAVMNDVLSAGDYAVVATYMGDDRFNSNVTSGRFTINGHVKKDTPISANVDVNGYKVTISVNVNESATGFVNMKFAEAVFNIELSDGTGSFAINLPANSYKIEVTYLGDENFNQNSTRLSFTVEDPVKENTPISLDVNALENNATFTVSVNSDATGIVRFEVSGAEEYVVYTDVINGVAVIENVLSVGDYTVVATYIGDDRFNSNITSQSFTIKGHVKKDTPISAVADVNGNKVTITVNVNESAEGFVGLKLSGSTIYIPVENGVATYVNTFVAGSYNVEVTYVGDDNFNENSTRLLFTVVEVVKENTPISIDVSSVEDYATFTVNVDSDATGIVRFEVSGAEEYVVYTDVLNGVAVLEDVLSVGDYTVVATYMGDDRFNSNVTSGRFTIKGHVKKDTPISAAVDVSGYKVTISVNVNESATGFVNMKFAEAVFNIELSDGTGSFAINLPANSYNIELTYLGDYNFNQNSTRLSFTVSDPVKENTPISLDVNSLENNATFTVSVNSDATGIVRFEVSGAEEYVVYTDVLNGVAVIENVLSVGDYTVVATYMGDDRFNSNVTSGRFTIEGHVKKDTPISADVNVNGYKVTIAVNVNESATGFVNMKFADTEYNVALTGGVGSLTVNLPASSYSVDVTYLGDGNFNQNSTRLSFTVSDPVKENTPISFVVNALENNATFTVSVNSDATGIVRFDVSGAEEYVVYTDVINGVAVIENVLSVGDYTVVATYMGDDRFNSNITSESFTIQGHIKKDTSISADAKVNGNKVTITVNVDSDATGFVGLKLSGSTIYIPVENGVASYINTYAAGSYNVELTYAGDDNFNENSTSIMFTVVEAAKENTPISLDINTLENNATFTVGLNSDAGGIVRFEVSGAENYTVYADVINGKAVMEDVLSAGDYEVVATYMGDNRFNTNVTSQSFTIKGHVKKDTPINANANVNGYKVSIAVNVDENATGFVNIKFADNEYNVLLDNGAGSLTVNMPAGSYNADVTYLGDDNFNQNMTKISFTVVDPVKENTTIGLVVTSVENNVTFTVSVNPDATGIVRFEVSGEDVQSIYVDVVNGEATINGILEEGDYTIIATYLGDSRFNTNTTSESFTVKGHVKNDTLISADAKVNGNRVTITVGVDANATGFVGLKLLGSTIYIPVENGVATYVNTYAAGSYNVEVTYTGDDNFNENSTRLLFTVVEAAKENTPIALDVSSVENNATFTVDVNPDATGIVRFDVSGAENYTVYADVINGKAVMDDVLSAGEYVVVATYMGDSKFNSNSTAVSFTILNHVKIDTPINAVPAVDGNTVTITTTVDSNATGFVTIGLLGQTFMIPVKDGKAVFTFDFAPGTYTANVIYLGDDNFNNASTTASFTVIKQDVELKNTTIDVDVKSVENDVAITAVVDSSASGLVEFNIGGKVVYIAVNNGKAVYDVILPAGDYNVEVTYLGDSKFNANTTSASFTVVDRIKKNTTIDSDAVVNVDNVTITVRVNENATGFVRFTMDGNDLFTEVNGGKAVLNVVLPSGNYTVTAIYLGDDMFNENTTSVSFSVDGRESADVNVTIPTDIPIGDNATIKIDIPDATGNVTVYVDGVEYVAKLINGSANVTIPGVSGGNHTVVVEYSGDDKYAPFTKVVTLNVPKVNIPEDDLKVNVTLPIGGKSPTVTIKLPEDTTGYVLVSVNGYDYHLDVSNGTATIKLPALSYGKHNVTVTYPGDDKYDPVSKNITVSIPKPVLNAKNVVYRYTYKGPFKVRVLVDGKAVIGQYVTFKFNGKTYKRLTNSKGYALFNVPTVKPKNYKITAKYNDISISKKIKVDNIIVVNTKKIKKSAKKVKVKVTLKTIKKKYLKSKKLTLKINGKSIKAKTNKKGVAMFTIKKSIVKKLKVGKIYVVKVSYGKDIITKKIKILR